MGPKKEIKEASPGPVTGPPGLDKQIQRSEFDADELTGIITAQAEQVAQLVAAQSAQSAQAQQLMRLLEFNYANAGSHPERATSSSSSLVHGTRKPLPDLGQLRKGLPPGFQPFSGTTTDDSGVDVWPEFKSKLAPQLRHECLAILLSETRTLEEVRNDPLIWRRRIIFSMTSYVWSLPRLRIVLFAAMRILPMGTLRGLHLSK